MTLRQFAGLIGVQMNTVWRWENGYPIDPACAELIRIKAPAVDASIEQPA
jgi:transcriptional regulator with XRE-family HTH domain